MGGEAGQIIDPGEYGDPVSPPPVPTRVCKYCGTEHPETVYKKHLFDEHCELVFLCDECDSYIDRRELIIHMSIHAAHYSTKKNQTVKTESKTVQTNVIKDEKEKRKTHTKCKGPGAQVSAVPEKVDCDKKQQGNEFSDHSDTESNFAPLPESVFEAIEDTKDNDGSDNDSSEPSQTEGEKKSPKHKKTRKCPICSKVYHASSSYFYHLKHSHKPGKDYECHICGMKFVTKANLKQHSTIHTGERSYSCEECQKRFRTKASLYIHMQNHAGVKMYSCGQCRSSFRWRTHLARHMHRHAAEKSQVCGTCGRAFKVRCDLLRHARTHAAGDFLCAKCGRKFAQLRYLKVHIKAHANKNSRIANMTNIDFY